jgi:hypothetical protein
MFADIDAAVEVLVDAIKTNYRDYTVNSGSRCAQEKVNDEFTAVNLKMIDDFESKITVKNGKKYIKICNGDSVWGFVVKSDNDKKFRKGDILKAASWAAPARNAARGNVFDGYRVQWTGPNYLK